jgi:hypothetical protein
VSESHLRIRHDFYRTPEYIEFVKSRKYLVYYFLLTSVIRESKETKMHYHHAHYIYRKHFLKGELVSRYSQSKLAVYLKTSQSRISKYVHELENDGFMKKIVVSTPIGNILYYQFGTWEGKYGTDTYKETIWAHEYFSKCYEAHQEAKVEKKQNEAYEHFLETMFNGDREKCDAYMAKFEN